MWGVRRERRHEWVLRKSGSIGLFFFYSTPHLRSPQGSFLPLDGPRAAVKAVEGCGEGETGRREGDSRVGGETGEGGNLVNSPPFLITTSPMASLVCSQRREYNRDLLP